MHINNFKRLVVQYFKDYWFILLILTLATLIYYLASFQVYETKVSPEVAYHYYLDQYPEVPSMAEHAKERCEEYGCYWNSRGKLVFGN